MSFSWRGLLGVGASSSSASNAAGSWGASGGDGSGHHLGGPVGYGEPSQEDNLPLWGLENFGNTCYANSVLQSLYFCRPFRDAILSYEVPERQRSDDDAKAAPTTKTAGPSVKAASQAPTLDPDSLFITLHRLFTSISKASSEWKALQPLAASPSKTGTLTGRGGKGSKTKAPSRPATSGGRIGTPTTNGSPAAAPSTLARPGVKRKDPGISAGPVDAIAVRAFLSALRRENILFDSTAHQDAHEFLNFMLNRVGEDLGEIDRKKREAASSTEPGGGESACEVTPTAAAAAFTSTIIHRLFEGTLTNETRCLTCEAVTFRDEEFLDLSIDIEHNSSVTACLRQFSASETLRSRNKFFCDTCSGLQEAEKRMKVRRLPAVLALHLKRFKYEEATNRYVKLAYRVVFPLELRLFNTADDAEDPDRLYELFGIVVHIGVGPHHGHYVSIVKVGSRWAIFDDESVNYIDQLDISKYFGDTPATGSAYVLFYQATDLDREKLGLPPPRSEEIKESMMNAVAAGTQPPSLLNSDDHLPIPAVASPASTSPTRAPATSHVMSTDSSMTSAGSGSSSGGGLFSRRKEASNSLTQAAEASRNAADAAAAGQKSSTGGMSGWRNTFGRGRDKSKRSSSMSEHPTGHSRIQSASLFAAVRPEDVLSSSPTRPGDEDDETESVSTQASSAAISRGALSSQAASAAGSRTALSPAEAAPLPVLTALKTAPQPQQSPRISPHPHPSPITEDPLDAPTRPKRHPDRTLSSAARQSPQQRQTDSCSDGNTDTPTGKTSPERTDAGEATKAVQPLSSSTGAAAPSTPAPAMRTLERKSTLPAQGATFAPVDKTLSKKEQQKIAKHARRRSSVGPGAHASAAGLPAGVGLGLDPAAQPEPYPPPPPLPAHMVSAVHGQANTGTVPAGAVAGPAGAPAGSQRAFGKGLPSSPSISGGALPGVAGANAAGADGGAPTWGTPKRRSTLSRFGLGKDKDKDKERR